jgi:hypothetical protein
MLPAYPEFEPVGLKHREEVSRLLAEEQPEGSELTFTNFFMWRQHYRFRVSSLEGCLLVLGQPPGSEPYLLPPVGPGSAVVCRRLMAEPLVARVIARVPEAYFARCGIGRGDFLLAEDQGQADYVYLVEELVSLAGRRFAGKRNHLKRFRKIYRWEYRPLDAGLVASCLQLEEVWCRARVCPKQLGLEAERVAIWEALENFGALGYSGGVILVEGRLEAFSLGEPLREDCVVIHIEKANPRLEGIYQAINQQFLEHEFPGFKFVNREQDLGDAGLRMAKLSYHPHHLVRKYTLRPR